MGEAVAETVEGVVNAEGGGRDPAGHQREVCGVAPAGHHLSSSKKGRHRQQEPLRGRWRAEAGGIKRPRGAPATGASQGMQPS